MPLYRGTSLIKSIYKGDDMVRAVYRGTDLVYPGGCGYWTSHTNGSVYQPTAQNYSSRPFSLDFWCPNWQYVSTDNKFLGSMYGWTVSGTNSFLRWRNTTGSSKAVRLHVAFEVDSSSATTYVETYTGISTSTTESSYTLVSGGGVGWYLPNGHSTKSYITSYFSVPANYYIYPFLMLDTVGGNPGWSTQQEIYNISVQMLE